MASYYIEEARCNVNDGVMCACGPFPGDVVASVRFRDRENVRWLSVGEIDGFPDFFLSDEDIYPELCDDNFDEDLEGRVVEKVSGYRIDRFEGIVFTGDYKDTIDSIQKNPNNPAVPLVRYLLALVRCEMEELDALIAMGTGRFAHELDIPEIDIEGENY